MGDTMTPIASFPATPSDAELVELSLAGDRQAFATIVARYQSLVCALAYSATGSRSHSEDLAQETFVTAWRKLRDLNDPGRLCGWLCGIARNTIHGDLRRLGRQPAHDAATLDSAVEVPSAEPLPTTQAVSNEEMAILWREVGRLPEIYREPLVLYYREHKSVEHVAAALDLTADAVMQRLTRGRRILQERMLEFVETTLQRTNPGPNFTLQVDAAIAAAGPAIVVGSAAQGSAAAKGGLLGGLLAWAAPLVGVFAAIGMSWAAITQTSTKRERRLVARWMLVLWICAAGLVVALPVVSRFSQATGLDTRHDWTRTAPVVALWFGFVLFVVTMVVLMARGRAALRRELVREGLASSSDPAPVSMARRIATTAGFLISLFWVLIFLAWQTGDRAVAVGIGAGAFIIGAIPLWLGKRHLLPTDEAKVGGWFLAFCGLVFLAILNWRLSVWLAPVYGVDLQTMQRLLPMALVHGLSVIAVLWTATLVFITRPDEKP